MDFAEDHVRDIVLLTCASKAGIVGVGLPRTSLDVDLETQSLVLREDTAGVAMLTAPCASSPTIHHATISSDSGSHQRHAQSLPRSTKWLR